VLIPLPQAIAYTGLAGHSEVLVYNPDDEAMGVTLFSDARGGTPVGKATVPPHGTRLFAVDRASGQVEYDTHDSGWIVPDGPAVTSVLTGAGTHVTALTAQGSPAKALALPVLAGGATQPSAAQLELTNDTDAATMVTISLRNTAGERVWQDKAWVCAHCVVTHQFWYGEAVDGFLELQMNEPLTATFLQREVISVQPFHNIGLSVLTLPGYALAGWRGAYATISVLAALLAVAIYGLLCDVGIARRNALIVAAVVGFSSPLVTHAVYLYTEIAGTLLLVVALRLVAGRAPLNRRRIAGALACSVAVPLVHSRLLPLSLVIVASLCIAAGVRVFANQGVVRPRGQWLWLLALPALAACAFAGIWWLEPRLRPETLLFYVGKAQFIPHLLGILFDRGTGLLPSLPLLLLAGSGFAWATRRTPHLGWTALALGLAQLAVVALRPAGWQLWGYPGRYIMPAVPFFAVALGATWERGFSWPAKHLARALAAWGLLVAAAYLWIPSSAYYTASPYSWYADGIFGELVGANPLRLFPVIPADARLAGHEALKCAGVLIAGLVLGIRWQPWAWRRPKARGEERPGGWHRSPNRP
jgi:hypothetical protein